MLTSYLKVLEQEYKIIDNNQIKVVNSDYVDYKEKICIKPWGYEFLIYESHKLGIWYLKIMKDHGTSLHTHFNKDTLIIVIAGTAKLTFINNEVISLEPMKSVFIPKNKFHALSSFSDEVFIMEIEIFNKTTNFSNKNDLLRIDDNYNRKRTGYESSVSLSDDLTNYDYFYLSQLFSKKIFNTSIKVEPFSTNILEKSGYNIIIDGELYLNGKYLKEGTILDNIKETDYIINNNCSILSITNLYANEDSKIIYSVEHLETIVKDLRSKEKKIILTSGCFDILHVGHVHNLKEAKKLGDCLIVCLSNDEQIKKLKGNDRPINNYTDRINLFKTLPYIDYIILYNEENIEKEESLGKIMKVVNAFCWVKGSDYNSSAIMEKHPYLNNIVLIENIKNKSTTGIINTIHKK